MEIYSAFHDFPKEAALVGRILSEYPELEFEMAQLTGKIINDPDQAIRIIFRAKGEETRIRIMDALVRPALNAVDLTNEYEAALGALRHCKSIRNQYAHAHWTHGDSLSFTNMETAAQTATGPTFITLYGVSVPLLESQERYMNYTSRWMYFLMDHYEHRSAAGSPTPAVQAPKIIENPLLYIPL